MKKAAVFLDRDGTINEDVGYLSNLSQLLIYPNAFEALRLLNAAGFYVVVITNQSGVARGYFPESFITDVHQLMQTHFEEKRVRIDGFYYCPHHPTEGEAPYRRACSCRKPEPGMLLQAAADLDIDLGRSFMIGDHASDIEAARRAGARGILVRTGHWNNHKPEETGAVAIADDILDAVRWILKEWQP